MELTSQKSSRKSRMRFFTRRSSSINSNVSFKSVGSTLSFSSANSGSKDESFFESKLNFESDADEEFHSVHEDSNSEKETSKSKLIDLLKEEQDGIKQEQVIESSNNLKLEKLSSIESRGSSVDEIIPHQSKIMRNRSFKAMPCCVPCQVFTSCVKDRRKIKTDTSTSA